MTCSHYKAAEFAGAGGGESLANLKVTEAFRLHKEVPGATRVQWLSQSYATVAGDTLAFGNACLHSPPDGCLPPGSILFQGA